MGVYSLLIFLADCSSYSEDITISKIVSVNVRSATLSEEKSRHKPLSVKKKKSPVKNFVTGKIIRYFLPKNFFCLAVRKH